MTDPISLWMNNAGRYRVLTAEETLSISQSIQEAEPGSPAHTRLVNKLCQHNLRLVVRFTRAYMKGSNKKLTWGHEQTMDLLQEGYFGLRRAAMKFDPQRGYAFSTYASSWIRQAVGKYHVDKLSMIRVPESSARELFYLNVHGKPRNEKVAKWLNTSISAARAAYNLVSYDHNLTNAECSILEALSDENRILEPSRKINYEKYYSMMNNLGIDPKLQEVIVSYCKRGNIETAMMKNKISVTKSNRAKVRGAIELVKAHCAQ